MLEEFIYRLLKLARDLSPYNKNDAEFLKHFTSQHLKLLSKKLLEYYQQGVPSKRLPYFEEEITPSLELIFKPFETVLHTIINRLDYSQKEKYALSLLKVIEISGLPKILILMGQRITPGSVQNQLALPPTNSILISSATGMYNKEISLAAKALSKHMERNKNTFWGKPSGSNFDKNRKAKEIILNLLNNKSWWNVFVHYQLGLVFETRLPEGHGARWSADGKMFIGFLEPFTTSRKEI
ncbi:hypothetical protein [Xanthovirga aplysinae]|uniref:hypothetical protein n=1 Tax=Xanthovirga aplysinae TaxID=2529853 RepID=UPI0012BBEC16|nr:hypothetical protein [Xanthovirga aplysinae]MTI32016.1 hypothetical protein [Xanthovirga aplysinae]